MNPFFKKVLVGREECWGDACVTVELQMPLSRGNVLHGLHFVYRVGGNGEKHTSNYPEMEGWQIQPWPSAGILESRAQSSPRIFKRNPIVSLTEPQHCQRCSPSLFHMVACSQWRVWPISFTSTAFTAGTLRFKGLKSRCLLSAVGSASVSKVSNPLLLNEIIKPVELNA